MESFSGRRTVALRRSLHKLSWYWPGQLRLGPAAGFRSCECLPLPRRRVEVPLNPEERYLATLTLTNQVVYDIGAHVGNFTLGFARMVGPAGWVVAFEPYPPNHRRLLRNLQLNLVRNVIPIRAAVANTSGRRNALADASGSGRISLSAQAVQLGMKPAGEVATVSLDELLELDNLPAPDFIKIDVEGLEWEVLQGAGNLLARRHPRLLIELHGADFDDKRANVRKILAFLHELGYAVEHLESGIGVTPGGDHGVVDGHLAAAA